MRPAAKKYSTIYKKIVREGDMYLPKLSPKEIGQCSGCGAFYHRRHWMLARPAGAGLSEPIRSIYCPACHKIKDRYPGGELYLKGVQAGERAELLGILRNEVRRAREKNPLEQIMRMEAVDGGWKVETTTEKLAQRLGRVLKKARGGKLQYKWGHNNKFVRVFWENRLPGQ